MVDSVTTNYGWSYPTVNADADTWGTTLNNTIDAIDTAMASKPGKNRIINGDMRIDQRNAGASSSSTGYMLDRWCWNATSSGKASVQQNAGAVTPPPGFTNYLGLTSLGAYSVLAADIYTLFQAVEGFNCCDLNWGSSNAKPITISFWVYSSLTGTFGGAVRNSAGSRAYPFTYVINSSNTWTYITVTIPGDTAGTWLTNNGTGLYLFFGIGVGTTNSGPAGAWTSAGYESVTGAKNVLGTNGATYYLTGVQLEIGSVATSFEQRDIASELVRCQRYYQNFGGDTSVENFGIGYASSTSALSIFVNFRTQMRTPPTLGTSGNFKVTDGVTATAFTGPFASNAASSKNTVMGITGLSGLTQFRPYIMFANSDLTARLTFDAEL